MCADAPPRRLGPGSEVDCVNSVLSRTGLRPRKASGPERHGRAPGIACDQPGKAGERGKLHDIFDTVMQLNLENGAAETKLDSNQQIDNAVINTLHGN